MNYELLQPQLSKRIDIAGRECCFIFALNFVVNFFAKYFDGTGGFNADFYLIAPYFNNGNFN